MDEKEKARIKNKESKSDKGRKRREKLYGLPYRDHQAMGLLSSGAKCLKHVISLN